MSEVELRCEFLESEYKILTSISTVDCCMRSNCSAPRSEAQARGVQEAVNRWTEVHEKQQNEPILNPSQLVISREIAVMLSQRVSSWFNVTSKASSCFTFSLSSDFMLMNSDCQKRPPAPCLHPPSICDRSNTENFGKIKPSIENTTIFRAYAEIAKSSRHPWG